MAAVRYLALIVLVSVCLLAISGQTASAASGTLKISPANQTVSAGQTFKVDIIQNADTATLGAQTNLIFDPAILKVVSVDAGPKYAEALYFAGVAPQTTEEAIAEANSTGKLLNITTFYLAGSGSVPAGEALFVTVTMTAKAGGTSSLKMEPLTPNVQSYFDSPIEILPDPPDGAGHSIPVTVTGGSVTVTGGTAPTDDPDASGTATPTATPKKSGTPRPSRTVGGVQDGPKSGVIRFGGSSDTEGEDGDRLEVPIGSNVELPLTLETNVDILGVQFDMKFGNDAVQLESVDVGEDWEEATLIAGGASSIESAITVANESGEVAGLGVSLGLNDDPVPAGETNVMTLSFAAADDDATADIEFSNVTIIDAEGDEFPGEFENGQIVIGEGGSGGGGAGVFMLVAGGGILLLGAGGALAFITRSRWSQSV